MKSEQRMRLRPENLIMARSSYCIRPDTERQLLVDVTKTESMQPHISSELTSGLMRGWASQAVASGRYHQHLYRTFQHSHRLTLRHLKLHPVPGCHVERKNLRVHLRRADALMPH